jgi:hypothetical protein
MRELLMSPLTYSVQHYKEISINAESLISDRILQINTKRQTNPNNRQDNNINTRSITTKGKKKAVSS